MNKGDQEQTTKPTACQPAHQRRLGILLCALAGVVLLFAVQQTQRRRLPADPEYLWVLSFPGTPPGVRFDTKPGDNLAAAVAEVLPEDETEWKGVLATTGELKFGLSCFLEKQVPLRTRVQWLRMDHRWRPAVTAVLISLPCVRVRTVPPATPGYEIVRTYHDDKERVAGPFVKYEEARRAAVVEIAKIMDRFQKGERIEGRDDWFPGEP